MEKIIVHEAGCKDFREKNALHVEVSQMDDLVSNIHDLMQKHNIPFWQVEPHNQDCPSRRFPWEDLEFRLFVLEH